MFSPTQCVFCVRSTDPLGFVNTGRELRPYGRLWVCSTCIHQMGGCFGMLAAADAVALRSQLHDATEECERLHTQLESASDRILVSKRGLEDIVREAVKA